MLALWCEADCSEIEFPDAGFPPRPRLGSVGNKAGCRYLDVPDIHAGAAARHPIPASMWHAKLPLAVGSCRGAHAAPPRMAYDDERIAHRLQRGAINGSPTNLGRHYQVLTGLRHAQCRNDEQSAGPVHFCASVQHEARLTGGGRSMRDRGCSSGGSFKLEKGQPLLSMRLLGQSAF